MNTTFATAPSAPIKAAPGFNLGVSAEAQEIITARGISDLVCRALLEYNLPESDLLDVLQNYSIERLEIIPLLKKPAALVKQLEVIRTGDTWAIVDTLGIVLEGDLESEVEANGMLGLLTTDTSSVSTDFPMHPDFGK